MPSSKIIAALIILTAILSLRTHYYYESMPRYRDGQHLKLIAVVSEEPKLSFGRQQVKVKTADGFRATLVTQVVPLYDYGDKLVIEGVFTEKHFKDFDYWTVYFPVIQIVKNDHNIITWVAYELRNKAKILFEKTLSPVHSSLLLGIVLGGKQGMPDSFLEKLRTVGVLHVIAASGMNVSFVAVFLVAVFGKCFQRYLALFTAILGIGFYVIVAGFEPSIIRAAIMSTLTLVASLLGRQSVAILALFITGYSMILVSPGLWGDVGFQLSFLATLGILILKPLLDVLVGKLKLIGEDVTTTTAAQIATLPVLLGTFGSYGLLSIFVNALILWTVPILMALGSLAILLGIVFEPLGKLPLFLSFPFLWYFELIVNLFGSIGWMLEIPKVSPVVWAGYYFLLAAVVLNKRKKIVERSESSL